MVGDLDRGHPDTARGSGDEDGVTGTDLADLDQHAVGGGVRQPHRGADPRVDAVRAAYDRGGRHDRLLTVIAVLVHQEGWNGADGIAGSEAVHPFADGLDGAGRLVPKPGGGEGRLVEVGARAVEGLSAVQTDRVHPDAQLAFPRLADLHILDPENFGSAELIEDYFQAGRAGLGGPRGHAVVAEPAPGDRLAVPAGRNPELTLECLGEGELRRVADLAGEDIERVG